MSKRFAGVACVAIALIAAIMSLTTVQEAVASSSPPTCYHCYWTFDKGVLVSYGCEATTHNGGTSCSNDGTTCNLSGSCSPTFNHEQMTPIGGIDAGHATVASREGMQDFAYSRLDCGIVAERRMSDVAAERIRSRTSVLTL